MRIPISVALAPHLAFVSRCYDQGFSVYVWQRRIDDSEGNGQNGALRLDSNRITITFLGDECCRLMAA